MNKIYETIGGDTWDLISYKVYGKEDYSDKLMEANIKYMDRVIFEGGIKLTCPSPEAVEEKNTPWR